MKVIKRLDEKLTSKLKDTREKASKVINHVSPNLSIRDAVKNYATWKGNKKPTNENKDTGFVGKEIKHLMHGHASRGPLKGKAVPQKQAVAIALNVAKKKGIKEQDDSSKAKLFTLAESLVDLRNSVIGK